MLCFHQLQVYMWQPSTSNSHQENHLNGKKLVERAKYNEKIVPWAPIDDLASSFSSNHLQKYVAQRIAHRSIVNYLLTKDRQTQTVHRLDILLLYVYAIHIPAKCSSNYINICIHQTLNNWYGLCFSTPHYSPRTDVTVAVYTEPHSRRFMPPVNTYPRR